MRSTIIVQILHLCGLHYALGSPYQQAGHVAASRQVAFPPVNLNIDCNKLLDQVLDTISKYPDYAAKAVGITAGTGLAYNVCVIRQGQTCTAWAGAVGTSLTLGTFYGLMIGDHKTEGANKVNARAEWLASQTEAHLRARGRGFDSVVVTRRGLGRRDADNGLDGHVVEVRGLAEGTGPDAPVFDHRIHVREDGVGHVSVAPSAPDPLAARAAGAGFKVSWHVTNYGTGKPEEAGSDFLADQIAKDWAKRGDSKDMGDYVGDMYFGVAGDMRVRIIPETVRFEDNFEDVNKCNSK